MEHLTQILLTAAKLTQQTDHDLTKSEMSYQACFFKFLKPYFNCRLELSLEEDNVLMWGNYVVVLSFVLSVGCLNCCTLLTLMWSV